MAERRDKALNSIEEEPIAGQIWNYSYVEKLQMMITTDYISCLIPDS
jgi:hypothetical protein